MLRILKFIAVLLVIAGYSGIAIAEDADDDPDPVILRILLADAPTTLQEAIATSEQHGMPISAKFEMSTGDLRFSVYTATVDGFVETIIDARTGKVISAEPVSNEDDLADAKVQKAVIARATLTLLTAIERAIGENTGSRAISVVPELRNEQAMAKVKLQRSADLITVSEPLN